MIALDTKLIIGLNIEQLQIGNLFIKNTHIPVSRL